jgi:hypothetical protein
MKFVKLTRVLDSDLYPDPGAGKGKQLSKNVPVIFIIFFILQKVF